MTLKRIVYVIKCDVPDHLSTDPYYINEMFRDHLVTWNSYFPQEGDDPIRINIEAEKVEEI